MTDIIAIYLAAGMFSGFVSGLFGVGGAFALAPALIITLTLQGVAGVHVMHLTIATSLATQLVTAVMTSVLRYRAGDLRLPFVARIAPFVAVGALAGAAIGDALPGLVLKVFFIGFVAFTIVRTLLPKPEGEPGGVDVLSALRGFEYWFLSILSGISGGLLGPGPAIVLAPYLRKRQFAMPVVAATSAALAGLIGATAVGGYVVGGFNETGLPEFSLGYLYLPGFACLAPGALIGSPLGIRFSHRVSDAVQTRLFVAYLTTVLIVMLSHSL